MAVLSLGPFDTFSYKSYLLLPRYVSEYWPRRDRVMPARVSSFIDHLARRRYADDWIPERGLVRRSGVKRRRAPTAPVDAPALEDPDVRYFHATNPGHAEGDMLVCLAPLTMVNIGRALSEAFVRRAIRRGRPAT